MRYSFNCFNHSAYYGIAPTLPEQISAAAAAGYDHVGLDVPSLVAHEADGTGVVAIRDHLDAAGLSCYELVPLPLGMRGSDAADRLSIIRRFVHATGAQQVLVTFQVPPATEVLEELRRAADVLDQDGVVVAVEFMATSQLRTLEDTLDLLDREHLGHVRIVVDSWHVCLSGGSWTVFENLPVERIGFVQLADAAESASGDNLDDCMQERLLPGEGNLPLSAFADVLKRNGYDGVVSVEVLSRHWRESKSIPEFAAATRRASAAVFS